MGIHEIFGGIVIVNVGGAEGGADGQDGEQEEEDVRAALGLAG